MKPKFSIVIPTRNRSATLRHTLRTCLDQTFADFEIVVSDNFSDDDTGEVVAALADSRVKYVRTSSYISMSRNFANGLRHASGEAIIFIGDDDGMLPFGLELLDRILTANPDVDAVRWHAPFFWWPGAREFQFRPSSSDFARLRTIEYPDAIWRRVTHPDILHFFEMTGFTLYHGCWRRCVVDRAFADGVDIFDGMIPDVLASIFGLRYARACIVLETPASVMGVSKKSNGWAQSAVSPSDDQKEIRDDFSARSSADFPDAPPITFVYCQMAPYFGSLLTYWMHTYGSLETFDHEAWRLIFLDQAVTFYADNAQVLCDRYNDFVPWLVAHGAAGARGISAADRQAHLEAGQHIPTHFAPPAPKKASLWSILSAPTNANPGNVSLISCWRNGDDYDLRMRTSNGEFTIVDFVNFYAALFGEPVERLAAMAATEAVLLQRRALTTLARQSWAPSRLARFLRGLSR